MNVEVVQRRLWEQPKQEERQLERFGKQLERLHLIVLDELGYVPFSKTGAELLFEVVSRAYERTSLIVTTNLPFEALDGGHGNGTADRSTLGSAHAPHPHSRSQR